MVNSIADTERDALVAMLKEAIAILRDNKPVRLDDPVFGHLKETKKNFQAHLGKRYLFRNEAIPSVDIILQTKDDPLDYSEDRSRVALVPYRFLVRYRVAQAGVSEAFLSQELDLADYWIAGEDGERLANDIGKGIPPFVQEHEYRYRVKERPQSRFPVDVQIFFIDPLKGDTSGQQPVLAEINIERAYPYPTPAMRAKKREEKQPTPECPQSPTAISP